MMRTVAADRIDRIRIARHHKGLATAPAEVALFPWALTAGIRHPRIAAKALKGRRRLPDPAKIVFANIVERQPRNHRSRVARQRLSRWINQHHLPSPSAYTGLGKASEVIRKHCLKMNLPFQPRLRRFD